jgi:DNA polymerase-1
MAETLGMSRFDTKTLTYSMQYGAGVTRIKEVFKVSEFEARQIRDNYFNTYPGFRSITQFAARKAEQKGYVKTWSGRRRHFQWPKTESFKAFNSVVQGGAADIVERTMLRLQGTGCNVSDCRMLLQVHDSIVFELREEAVEDFKPKIIKAMEDVEPDFGVKFSVDFKEWGK